MNTTPSVNTSASPTGRSHTMGRRALVLGGGGAAANAWLIGVIAGLSDAGLDVTDADLIIGTSAGSTTAVQITGTTPASELLAAVLAATPPPRTGSDRRRPANRPAVDFVARAMAAAVDAADMRRELGAAMLDLDATLNDPGQTTWRATVAARIPGRDWPRQRLLVPAVDAHTGEPVVFDRHSGVDLVDAVAAATSGPGGPPYTIGGHRYMDGGFRSAVNADLAAGCGRVLALVPFGDRSLAPREWGIHLAAEVGQLHAHGSRVETVFPDSNCDSVFGPNGNVMDPSNRPLVAQAGYDQAQALADRLAEFWR